MLRSTAFWEQRPLHPVARVLLLVVVGVLVCVEIGFAVATGEFTRNDLLDFTLYSALAAFAWYPMTAAFVIMVVSGVGVVFSRSAGDVLEFAIILGLVAVMCARWVVITYIGLFCALAALLVVDGSAFTPGGVFVLFGVAAIALLTGITFRLVAARESLLVAERSRVVKDLEVLARAERERIADELHDGIAHDLTLILFHARALPIQPDEAGRQVSLATIEDSAEQALTSIQALLSFMKDSKIEPAEVFAIRYDGHLVDAVSSLGSLLKKAGIPTRVTASPGPLGISRTEERLLTETAIEAVTNVIKHAPKSQSVNIVVTKQDGRVELTVKNVASVDSDTQDEHAGGRGLNRARQRLAECNGNLEAARIPEGWALRATIPAIGRSIDNR